MAEGDFELAKKLCQELGIAIPEPEHLTDDGNAARLVRLHGIDLRYCKLAGDFYCWDDVRWLKDDKKRPQEFARDVYREVQAIAGHLAGRAALEVDTEKSRKLDALATAFDKWGETSEGRERLWAMVDLAKSMPAISTRPDDFDRDPFLLNNPSGTLDLRTHRLYEHRREDFLTLCTAALYIPDARLPLWTEFVQTAIPDPKLREYLQKAAGRSLEGRSGADLIILMHGPGGTGKTTFQEALGCTLGDYAALLFT